MPIMFQLSGDGAVEGGHSDSVLLDRVRFGIRISHLGNTYILMSIVCQVHFMFDRINL